MNSLRGFEVVDEIKTAVDKYCNASVISCADILAVAARDSVEILGGHFFFYEVLLGRRDPRNASLKDSNDSLPKPFADFPELISNFQSHGLDLKDLVVLSGGHSIGLAKCVTFGPRIYNDTNIDKSFATYMQQWCPVSGGDNNTEPLDATPAELDTVYYKALLENKSPSF
uniref:peroxidase n=1 Tax=Quercus lobata TaxID=97700 RepID=A0A7N2KNJ3_QUELO